MSANLENSAVATGLEKFSFHSNPRERQCLITTVQLHLFHMLARLCSKSFKLGLSNTLTGNFHMYELDLARAEEPELLYQFANRHWIAEKARESHKNVYFCFIDYAKMFDCVDHNKLKNSSRDGNTRSPYLPSAKGVCRSRSNSKKGIWHNGLVPNWERSMLGLYIVNLLI